MPFPQLQLPWDQRISVRLPHTHIPTSMWTYQVLRPRDLPENEMKPPVPPKREGLGAGGP